MYGHKQQRVRQMNEKNAKWINDAIDKILNAQSAMDRDHSQGRVNGMVSMLLINDLCTSEEHAAVYTRALEAWKTHFWAEAERKKVAT